MHTYSVFNPSILTTVVLLLRGEGCRAWAEIHNGSDVLCTDAGRSLVAMCSGDGLWATMLFNGLP